MPIDCKEIDCCPEPMSVPATRYQAGGGEVPQDGVLINVDFNSVNPTTKVGFAATGINDLDFWNTFDAAQAAVALALKWSTGALSPVTIRDVGSLGGTFGVNGNTDIMLSSFMSKTAGGVKQFDLVALPEGTYDLYLYGWDNAASPPNRVAQWFLFIDGTRYPDPATYWGNGNNNNAPPWVRSATPFAAGNYVLISGIPIVAGQILQIYAFQEGAQRFAKISGFQLLRSPAPPPPGPGLGSVTPVILSGTESFFASGAAIVAGVYRVTLINGAMRYGPEHGFSVNFGAPNEYVITHSGSSEVSGPWDCNLPTQAEVEAAFAGTYVDFTHTGGPISMRLQDALYPDNIAGSPNPTFALSRLS